MKVKLSNQPLVQIRKLRSGEQGICSGYTQGAVTE